VITEEPLGNSEHNRSFRTHAGYLGAFRTLAAGRRFRNRDQFLPDLAERSLRAYEGSIKPLRIEVIDEATVRSCLNRAWGTETILCTTAEVSPDADLLRLALSWSAVQTYYACYAAAQAVLVAEGNPRSEQHNNTQKQVVSLWVERAFSLAPWSLAATEPGSRNACVSGFLKGPGRPLDLTLHSWAALRPGQEWDRAGKALATTREERVAEALAQARDTKRRVRNKEWQLEETTRKADGKAPRKIPKAVLPNLKPLEKAAVRSKVRPFTMLDYLYRLRIKANYIDNELFSQGPESDSSAVSFATHMQDIVAATLLVHELRLTKLINRAWVLNEADNWLTKNAMTTASYGLSSRRKILADA
jgi:hypothetical protein